MWFLSNIVFFCAVLMEMVVNQASAATEPGVIESLFLAANKRPWLWSVYVFSVGLPIILFISVMWPDKRFGPPDQPYYYKKSDEVQPDDFERSPRTKREQINKVKSEEMGENVARKRDVHKNMKKSDLDLKIQ